MEIKVRSQIIGGSYIPIQTMLKNPVWDVDLSMEKIIRLSKSGCDIIRITIPDEKALQGLKTVIKKSPIPIVADIHFDYRLAIGSIEAGVDKVRINPGNIGDKSKVKKVIECLKYHNTPVRIGINKGSLPEHLKKLHKDPIDIMIAAAKEEIGYFLEEGYENIVLSFKSSTVMETIHVNREAAKLFGYPLHIGVTEAGDLSDGTIKNAIGIGTLLQEGIGNTIRVSLTAPEDDEIRVGKKILESIGLRSSDIDIISCPTCGRTEIDLSEIVRKVKECTAGRVFTKKLKIAIMGCIVNGPGEASECDFGIAGGVDKSLIFKDGKKIKTVHNNDIIEELGLILEEYTKQ